MHMYMYICICVYIYIYPYLPNYLCANICMNVSVYMCMCVNVFVCIYIYMYVVYYYYVHVFMCILHTFAKLAHRPTYCMYTCALYHAHMLAQGCRARESCSFAIAGMSVLSWRVVAGKHMYPAHPVFNTNDCLLSLAGEGSIAWVAERMCFPGLLLLLKLLRLMYGS